MFVRKMHISNFFNDNANYNLKIKTHNLTCCGIYILRAYPILNMEVSGTDEGEITVKGYDLITCKTCLNILKVNNIHGATQQSLL